MSRKNIIDSRVVHFTRNKYRFIFWQVFNQSGKLNNELPINLYFSNRRLIFGEGKIAEIPGIFQWYQKKKVFFAVYDVNAPVCKKICAMLEEAGIQYYLYDKVRTEPDLHMINGGRDIFLEEGCDCCLAVGGGSVIDVTKAIGMLANNGGMVEEYQMEGRQATVVPPLFIAVPTASGTGAEATKTSVVLNNYNGLKKSLYHTTMIAEVTILDPTLTLGMPAKITSATGMDALSHAIESYVSLNATPVTEMYGLKAIELIKDALPKAMEDPNDLEARAHMMLASYFGGVAITAGIGIAHIMAQPLGGMYHLPHGDACSIFLPASMELNLDYAAEKYAQIAKALGVYSPEKSPRENGLAAIDAVKELRKKIGAPDKLTPYIEGELPSKELVIDTVKRTTGHITCNPKPLTEDLMWTIFQMVL